MEEENRLSNIVIGCAIEVHRVLGPGLLESAYQECLLYELAREGLEVKKELKMPIQYKGLILNSGYRIDLLVNDKLVLEIKSVDSISDLHLAQLLTYLKFGKYRLGLILNFNTTILSKGIKRVIN